jgi:hypothetical protein
VEANPLYRESLASNRKHHLIAAVANTNKLGVRFRVHEGANGPEGLKYASHSSLACKEPYFEITTIQLTLGFIQDMWAPIDLLCIDVEGGEMGVLEGLTYKPKLICLEYTYDVKGLEWVLDNGYRELIKLGDDAICERL